MLIARGTLIVVSVSGSGPGVEVVSSQARVPFCSSTYTRWLSERATNQIGGELVLMGEPTLCGNPRVTMSNPLIVLSPWVATDLPPLLGVTAGRTGFWPARSRAAAVVSVYSAPTVG